MYGPKSIKLRNVSPENVEQTLGRLFNSAFYKPERYDHEQEYRFVFRLTDEQKLYPAGK